MQLKTVTGSRADEAALMSTRRIVGPVLVTLIIILGTTHFALSRSGVPMAHIFDLDTEAGLGTWFSSVLAFTAAGLATVIAVESRSRQMRGWYWWALLGLGLLALSVDEIVQVHEVVGGQVGAELRGGQDGALMAGTPLLGIALLPALLVGSLVIWKIGGRRARALLIVGLLVFWAGAFGFEELEYRNYVGSLSFTQGMAMETGDFLLVGVQEILELTGLALIITGLLSQLRTFGDRIRVGPVDVSV